MRSLKGIRNEMKDWNKIDRDRALSAAIVLAYKVPLIYDYTIPDSYHIVKLTNHYLRSNKDSIPKELYEELGYVCNGTWDEYAPLERFVVQCESLGMEWFCMKGTFFRWREGAIKKIAKLVKEHVTDEEMEILQPLRDYIMVKDIDELKTRVMKLA